MPGQAPTRIRLSAAQRRERVLTAAAAEFATCGYGGASLRAIAASAGVTTPVIYDHFGSKSDLHAAVVTGEADALRACWAQPPAQPTSAEEVFRHTIDGIFGWIEEHPYGWRILFAETPAEPSPAASAAAVQAQAAEALAGLFATLPALDHPAGIHRGRADRAYAEAAKSAVNGLAAWWWDNRDVPRATVAALATDLLWRGLQRVTTLDAHTKEPR